ncbi:MAG: hypothetical protein PHV39_03880 [Methanomicrobium sp.]|nr:hypothetical protein [Methanomicrobium sp.]
MRKKLQFNLFILLLILAGLFIPAVNAEINDDIINKSRVDLDTAYQSALISINPYIAQEIEGCFDDPDMWVSAYIEKSNPLKVYDISGELLYYEFDIAKNGIVIGEVRASANKLLGNIVPVISCTPNKLKENLTYYENHFENLGFSVTIISYITGQGLLVDCNDSDNNSFVFDTYWVREIPIENIDSFYLNYNKNPDEEIERWDHEFSSMISSNIENNEFSKIDSINTTNMPEKYQKENTDKKDSPGFSGIVAVIVLGVIIFVFRRFS